MRVLILGSGGREHTFAQKIFESPQKPTVFVAPGNAGTAAFATNIPLDILDFQAVKKCVLEHQIELVVVGPEAPLVKGIHDFFSGDDTLQKIPVIGPKKAGAMLEGSKDFSKEFMTRHQIPTARYGTFTAENLNEGKAFLETMQPPFVLKADGLAGGKGVLIIDDLAEAKNELSQMLTAGKFGKASEKVVIEEFLNGIELSVFVLTDGKGFKILPSAKDYKRIGEGDTGLNTGGMGAISPVPFADEIFLEKVEKRVITPTINGLKKDGIPYKGFIFIGLMNVGGNPFVIEYNVRMGDPETEVVIARITSDFLALLQGVAKENLTAEKITIRPETATTVMTVAGGYPDTYEKGAVINGLETVTESYVYHAGTKKQDGKIVTNGGRVMAFTSFGKDIKSALEKSYRSIEKVQFDKMYFRSDIGFDL